MKKNPKKLTRKEILHMPQGAEMDAATERFVRLSPNAPWSPSSRIVEAMFLLFSRQRDGWEWDIHSLNEPEAYRVRICKGGNAIRCAVVSSSLNLAICRAVLLAESEER